VLYDDFNGRWIDPTKWDDSTGSVRSREAVRELSPPYQGEGNNRRLHIFQRAYSWTGNNDGVEWGGLGLQFTNPASINEVSFDVLVNRAAISGCPANPSTGTAYANFSGTFFNYLGADVYAGISLIRESNDAQAPLRVQAGYNSADWSISDSQTLGYVSLGQTAKLRVRWDQPNHQFIFQLNRDPEVIMGYGSGILDTIPPSVQTKGLGIARGVPHCAPPSPLGSAMINAYFDNVYVNAP
jgi:hypothetical protein